MCGLRAPATNARRRAISRSGSCVEDPPPFQHLDAAIQAEPAQATLGCVALSPLRRYVAGQSS
jgi:hypothetical protein